MQDFPTVWVVAIGFGILTIVFVIGLFKPSGLGIHYDAQSFFEVRRLFFAAGVLAVLAFILILSIAIYVGIQPPATGESPAKVVFDSMVKIIPPIMTLVLGYYFGQSSVTKPSSDKSTLLPAPGVIPAKNETKPSAAATDAQTTP